MCEPDFKKTSTCIIVSPLGKPKCFWGKQWLICLNNNNKKSGILNGRESGISFLFFEMCFSDRFSMIVLNFLATFSPLSVCEKQTCDFPILSQACGLTNSLFLEGEGGFFF